MNEPDTRREAVGRFASALESPVPAHHSLGAGWGKDVAALLRALLARAEAAEAELAEWRAEPPGGIIRGGVLYQSPERVAEVEARAHAFGWRAGAEATLEALARDADCMCAGRPAVLAAKTPAERWQACQHDVCDALSALDIRTFPLPQPPEIP